MYICLGRKVVGPQPIKPIGVEIKGRYACLRPMDPELHAKGLYDNFKNTKNLWDFLFDDEPQSFEYFQESLRKKVNNPDIVVLTIFDVRDLNYPLGTMNFMRIEPAHRCIEVGSITFSSKLQKSRVSTEALFLLINHTFELGYHRLYWKCNNNNVPSKKAAERLGFTFEGIFRRHMIIKNHCRDTAWFAIIDENWPKIKAYFYRYLDPSNFDEAGIQKTKLQTKTI